MEQRWRVLAGILVARIAFGFQFQALAVVGPGIAADLGIGAAAMGTLIGLFMLPGVVLALPGGILADRFGERRMLGAGLAGMAFGGLACGLADSFAVLVSGRLLAGVGGIVVAVSMSKVVIDWFSGHELATAMGLFLGAIPLGFALALAGLGGAATPALWPAAPLASAAFALLALATFALTFRTAGTAAAAPQRFRIALSLREAVLVSLAGLSWALVNGALFVMLGFLPLYLAARGYAPPAAAALVGILPLLAIGGVPLGGFLADRLKRPDALIVLGTLTWGAGMLLVIPAAAEPALLAPLLAASALAGTLPAGPLAALPGEVLSPAGRAQGLGLFYTWFYAGAAGAPAAAGGVLQAVGEPVAAIYLTVGLLLAAMAAFVSFRLLQRRIARPA